VAIIADVFANQFQRILFKKYRDIVFNSVSQYTKDHQDPKSVLKNQVFKLFMARSPEAKEKCQTDSQWRKYECQWNLRSQSVRLVGLEWDCSGIAQNPSKGKFCTEYRLTINILTK